MHLHSCLLASVPSGRRPALPPIVRHSLGALSAKQAGILGMCPVSLVNLTLIIKLLETLKRSLLEFSIGHLAASTLRNKNDSFINKFLALYPCFAVSKGHPNLTITTEVLLNDPIESVIL